MCNPPEEGQKERWYKAPGGQKDSGTIRQVSRKIYCTYKPPTDNKERWYNSPVGQKIGDTIYLVGRKIDGTIPPGD